jgi:hypothetical protein
MPFAAMHEVSSWAKADIAELPQEGRFLTQCGQGTAEPASAGGNLIV